MSKIVLGSYSSTYLFSILYYVEKSQLIEGQGSRVDGVKVGDHLAQLDLLSLSLCLLLYLSALFLFLPASISVLLAILILLILLGRNPQLRRSHGLPPAAVIPSTPH